MHVFKCARFLVYLRNKNCRNTYDNLKSSEYTPPGVSKWKFSISIIYLNL